MSLGQIEPTRGLCVVWIPPLRGEHMGRREKGHRRHVQADDSAVTAHHDRADAPGDPRRGANSCVRLAPRAARRGRRGAAPGHLGVKHRFRLDAATLAAHGATGRPLAPRCPRRWALASAARRRPRGSIDAHGDAGRVFRCRRRAPASQSRFGHGPARPARRRGLVRARRRLRLDRRAPRHSARV